jgi:hypothetical protein
VEGAGEHDDDRLSGSAFFNHGLHGLHGFEPKPPNHFTEGNGGNEVRALMFFVSSITFRKTALAFHQ